METQKKYGLLSKKTLTHLKFVTFDTFPCPGLDSLGCLVRSLIPTTLHLCLIQIRIDLAPLLSVSQVLLLLGPSVQDLGTSHTAVCSFHAGIVYDSARLEVVLKKEEIHIHRSGNGHQVVHFPALLRA